MVAVISAALTPISVLSEKRSEPRKFLSKSPVSPLKIPNFNTFSTTFHSGLALSSSFLHDSAKALTYEEALNLSTTPSNSNEFLDSAINFAAENPLVLAGGAAILGLPLILSQVFQKPKPWGIESAKKAYAILSEDSNAQLLDIRAPVELRKAGKPDVSGLKKKPVSVAYNGEDKSGFLKKLSLKFKEPENTTLFILDKFDGDAELVAELVTVNGFKAAYAIKDGAEGPRGWLNSGLPWIQPSKGLSFDLSSFTGALGDGTDALGLTVGIAAATGLGVLAFSEIETILQVLGSAAIIQFATKKLLFAEDRKQTLQQVDEFLNTKVAPKELVDEIKQIGKALLPETVTSKSLPAAEQSSTENSTVKPPSSEAAPADSTAAEPTPKVNSVKSESVSRPLSPYPYYPDFKPPASPTPSQP